MIRPFHILIVEDNEGDVLLIQEALQQWNIVVKTSVVRDGGDAIDFLEKNGMYQNAEVPDIILLDVNLPKVNGHEVLKYIKGTLANIQIPVIILPHPLLKTILTLPIRIMQTVILASLWKLISFLRSFRLLKAFG